MSYILHEKEAPMFYSSYGSFIHKILERFYKGELKQRDLALEFLLNYKDNIEGKRPSDSVAQKYIQNGYDYFLNFTPLPYKVLGVEKKVNFEIDGINFVGFIDLVGEKDGEIYIIDNKSRDLKPRSKRKNPTQNDLTIDKMLRQLYLYAKAIKDEYGKFPKKLCFNCFRTGTFIEEEFNIESYNEAVDWAKRTINLIKITDEFYPNIEFFSCKYICGFSDSCCYNDLAG